MDHLELKNEDPNAVNRKRDHIELALKSQINKLDTRFYYEPLFAAHPDKNSLKPFTFLKKTMKVPMWVSSMTGGTEMARIINRNLARACGEFGFGMGLGSCRQLLHSDEHLDDFRVRSLMGDGVPLFANLGIAQLETLIERDDIHLITQLLEKLEADGLIIHVNPMQEWLQPEGDRFQKPPIETIKTLIAELNYPLIVKEVGQGFGYESLKALLQLPLAAVDFAAAGGTSFSKLELLRGASEQQKMYGALAHIGHSATEMVDFTNHIVAELGDDLKCQQVIVSGGIQDFLDGFYCIKKLALPAIYGQASAFLKHAQGDYADLKTFVEMQIRGLELAEAFLRVR
ncbi:MAG: type 2 isopentenyl-diphosphate Delta-isomerase [Saprospiraceae bacterium]|nr:type 2 isopentenyl-diphosphate Delta-isomerase [Saprospiraceae bacterium]